MHTSYCLYFFPFFLFSFTVLAADVLLGETRPKHMGNVTTANYTIHVYGSEPGHQNPKVETEISMCCVYLLGYELICYTYICKFSSQDVWANK